jgi:predicted flap endonuclease-1-like 5' DNA nuclease
MIRTLLGSFMGLAVAVAGVGLFVWLLWVLWSRREEEAVGVIELEMDEPPQPTPEEEASVATAEVVEEAVEEAEPLEEEMVEESPEEAVEAPVADDLTRIEGIGPKISSVLQEAGITTFAQLADTDPGSLEEILEAADPRLRRLANPATWPEQAALAAAGEWEAHEALRGELKGGRRV